VTHRTFFIADNHFSHANIITFNRNDGTRLRDFASAEEMDEHMVECWNRVVRPQDTVNHLGDVVINRRALPILSRLNGKKRLIRGNHDIFKTAEYMQYFDEIYGVRVYQQHGIICSHIPLHPESLSRWKVNVHGHLHANRVMTPPELLETGCIMPAGIDPRYINVSVEQINYTPISLEEIIARMPE